MKAILTVLGKDKVGIIAQVSTILAKNDINILDVSQTIMDDDFVMMMQVSIPQKVDFKKLTKTFHQLGKKIQVEINLRNAKLFAAMHEI